ncbi:MAG: PEGA domain-containing protein [Pseudomonadota bacterium]
MKRFVQWGLAGLAALLMVGCSSSSLPSFGNLTGKDEIVVPESKQSVLSPSVKYGATIRMARYADERQGMTPRKIGEGAENVAGMFGHDIVTDQDVADMVTNAMRKRLDDAGFQVYEKGGDAAYEVSGVVKELTLNVKARDEIMVKIETTLKEVATGKVVWSGVVVEKNDRFAGIGGNDKGDVALYLKKSLGIVTQKTVDAVSASLMASRPDLFNLTPGTKPIPGVTVLVAPSAPVQNVPATPAVQTGGALSAPASAYTPRASATTGLLLVNSNPQRAKVYVDGVYFGLSPLRVEVEPGVHAISVKLEGYKMATDKVSVRRGDNTEMDINLER